MIEQHLCIKHEGSEFWNATIWFPVREGHVYGYFIDATDTQFIWEVKDGVKRISDGLIAEWHLQDGKFVDAKGSQTSSGESNVTMDGELFGQVEQAAANMINQYLWHDSVEESFELYSPYFYENGLEMMAVNFKPEECEELFRHSDGFVICDEEIDELHDDLNEMFGWLYAE
ncbi:hypothetical protein [Sulfurirhabdus autotrophica]|uniref:Uncharacterized protein n=1 Tax=Sulfurirhabdus autotrophica TaxID=1706046 RepID=A0A4R3XVM5_9PROT|nr:hypothetical protein [Sulfurirhabdus autotrophica]TCV82977.1 hypothetical protein EDC63_11710 [Sulfurirhabdus autotrophica]